MASRYTVSFDVFTADHDNRRAAAQLVRIREVQREILSNFTKALAERFPEAAVDWNLEALLESQRFDGNFFRPGSYSYELGRYPAATLSEQQRLAKARDDEIYALYKPQLAELWRGRPTFTAPVVRIRVTSGETTYAIYPADVRTCVDMVVSMRELKEKGQLTVAPPVPANYEPPACA